MRFPAFRALALHSVFSVAGGSAQVISIRTIPMAQSHQFDLFPSFAAGMGGVSIAVDDSLQDPFVNPAWGTRIRGSTFFASPGMYRVSRQAGAGRTLPLGAFGRVGAWFGGAALALQRVEVASPVFNPIIGVDARCASCAATVVDFPEAAPSKANGYGFLMLGRAVSHWTVAGSASWSVLNAVDGVDQLYAGAAALEQRGNSVDLRLGAVRQFSEGRQLSGLLLHNRLSGSHKAFYLDNFWDPGQQLFQQRTRMDENRVETNTWGMQLEYQLPLRAPGWRLGWTATANLMSHPKLPNYQLQAVQSIPRDPGNSEAFNIGIGVAKSIQSSTFAADLIYEPIWSYTWADAAAPISTQRGAVIPVGGKTIENRFRFSNAIFRMGFSQDIPVDETLKAVGLQMGLMVHGFNYSLAQYDNVNATSRAMRHHWTEWAPTWGLSVRFPALEVRYRGSVLQGSRRPGFDGIFLPEFPGPTSRGDLLVAPTGGAGLAGVKVFTHQISLSVPLR